MLELRPNCENCNKDLLPDSTEAYICTYECTFCSGCVSGILKNVCPNCGGGFTARPIRPKIEYRPGLSRTLQPASTVRVSTKYREQDIEQFIKSIKDIKPENR